MLPIIQNAPPDLGAALAAIQALTPAANKAPVFSSSSAAALQDFVGAAASWTPTLTFSTPGDLSVSYTTQLGRYWRFGNMVVALFSVETSSFTYTTASGNLLLGATLPYTSENTSGLLNVGTLSFQGITKAGYTQFYPRLFSNSSTIAFFASSSGSAVSQVTSTDVPSAGTVVLRGVVVYVGQ